jgi:hypothetical protein
MERYAAHEAKQAFNGESLCYIHAKTGIALFMYITVHVVFGKAKLSNTLIVPSNSIVKNKNAHRRFPKPLNG